MARKPTEEQVPVVRTWSPPQKSEARLCILRLLLSAHPDGMTVGAIGSESHLLQAETNSNYAQGVLGECNSRS
jgi:hypothetical protein